MDLPKNAFKAALKARQRQIGIWVSIPDPANVELLSNCGYDWILLDAEHTPIELDRGDPVVARRCAPSGHGDRASRLE